MEDNKETVTDEANNQNIKPTMNRIGNFKK